MASPSSPFIKDVVDDVVAAPVGVAAARGFEAVEVVVVGWASDGGATGEQQAEIVSVAWRV